MKKYDYVYITTNLVNGKSYIGDHHTTNLKDTYLGSGSLIGKAIKKYGKENFEKQILEQFNTKKEAFDAQEKYIIKYNTLTPNGYNISPKGGHQVKDSVSEESKQKMKIAAHNRIRKPLSDSHKENIRKALKDKPLPEETIQKMKKPKSKKHCENISKSKKGKKLSVEHCENIRKSRIGGHGPTMGKHFDKILRKYI
jgi:group I intron endonuclease